MISSMLAERIAAGDFPSAVYMVAERGRARFADALGQAVNEPAPDRHAPTLDTIYDLASLTKPLVTGLLCARRIESGEFSLDGEVGFYLPEFDRFDKCTITLGQLLTHTSGLPAWRPFYIEAEDRTDVLRVIAEQPLEAAPGTRVRYSDLGFITLGLLLEKLSGAPLYEIARREIFEPLGLKRTFFNPDVGLQAEVAACELGNAYEREMCRELKMRDWAHWREQLIWGEVHDGNAHFLGGAAGHAGPFSPRAGDRAAGRTVYSRQHWTAAARNVCALSHEHDRRHGRSAFCRLGTGRHQRLYRRAVSPARQLRPHRLYRHKLLDRRRS